MKASKSNAACGQASGGAKKGDVYGASVYQYTPKRDQCQVIIALLDHCLETYQHHRARFVITGDDDDHRLAEIAKQDRLDLLAQLEGADD